MPAFKWDRAKNERIFAERGVSFEQAAFLIAHGRALSIKPHPNRKRYPNQYIAYVEIGAYIYLVPFVESDDVYWLKTIIPSRKATREMLGKRRPHHET